MSSIVKGDSEIKRNEDEKLSASDEKTQDSEKRNRKTKNKSKTKKSEPKIISDDSESGPSKSSSADLEPGPSGLSGLKQTETSEETALAETDHKKSEKTLDKNIPGYGLVWDIRSQSPQNPIHGIHGIMPFLLLKGI